MTTWTTPQPMVDSEVNARLRPLKAANWNDDAAIGALLEGLLADIRGRASLVEHLADMAVLGTDESMTDEMRGRILRRCFTADHDEPTPPRPGGLMARLTAAREARTAVVRTAFLQGLGMDPSPSLRRAWESPPDER